jgi:hypothetical protein
MQTAFVVSAHNRVGLFSNMMRRSKPMKTSIYAALTASALIFSTAALAGEIKGPPPSGNNTADEIDIHARSFCAFSGLNDTPLGQGQPGDPEFDPGGQTQSFGSFFGRRGFPVSSLDPKTTFGMPGFGCNPNRGVDLHGGE